MFKPVRMQKIQVVCLRSISKDLVADLHEIGAVQVTPVEQDGLPTNMPFEEYQEVSKDLVRIRAVENVLRKYKEGAALEKAGEFPVRNLDALEAGIIGHTKESSALENEIKRKQEDLKMVKNIASFNVDFSSLKTGATDFVFGSIPRQNFARLVDKLKSTVKDFKYLYKTRKQDVLVLVLYPSELSLDSLLTPLGFNKFTMPKDMKVPAAYIQSLQADISEKKRRLDGHNGELRKLASKYYTSIIELKERNEILIERAGIGSKFGMSGRAVLMAGWIRKDKVASLQKTLASKYGEKAQVTPVSTKEKPPVLLENPTIMGEIQYFVHVFSLPNAREFDPTFIYYFTVPLIYGMIVGDFFYGLLSLLLSLLIMKKSDPDGMLHNIAKLWAFASIPAMMFGIAFDEWMGASHYHWIEYLQTMGLNLGIHETLYHGFSRLHNLTGLIGITALLGIFQLGLGFIIGALNELGHNNKHALAKIAWLGVEVGGVLATMVFVLNMFPETYGLIGLGVLGVSIVVLALTEGIMGVMEVPGLAGNILSYTRIAAVGVVGVVLAEMINDYFTPTPESGLLMTLVLIPMFLALHMVNVIIVMVESIIQGGRLNIVEFQGKFLHGGGKIFSPFRMLKK